MSASPRCIPTEIPEVIRIQPRVFEDSRGFFFESWNARAFERCGLDVNFVQDNHSRSNQGCLRGLHYQLPNPQGKLVRVVVGQVYDVAVDLRRSSSTFGNWVAVELSSENRQMLWIPGGFAHGFYVTSTYAELLYKCTDFYSPADERCLRWDDPDLDISWPLADNESPLVSDKDAAGSSFRDAECFP
jgi:dTDP-4-dehydrorhamnose 3,5-epimerase